MNLCKERGWSKKGHLLSAPKRGQREKRLNVRGAINGKSVLAPVWFRDSCSSKLFDEWVCSDLVKELQPGQVVILENASFHKSKKALSFIERVGCRVLFLPAYCPDYNPIEHLCGTMKRWLPGKIKGSMSSVVNVLEHLEVFFNRCFLKLEILNST